jgi:uncharacterized MAPEG superfamily protein
MHSSILRRIWFNFVAYLFVFFRLIYSFRNVFRISGFFGLGVAEETWVVEVHIWCIKIGIVLVLHIKNYSNIQLEGNTTESDKSASYIDILL